VRNAREPIKLAGQEITHSLVPLREHLICVPIRALHDSAYRSDVLGRYTFLKEIAHRVNEHPLWRSPSQWLVQFLGNYSQVKALFVRMAPNSTKSFGKSLGITVLAARAYLGAPADGIPSGVGPFYGAFNCHRFIGELKAK
jgi:hypothetical protein